MNFTALLLEFLNTNNSVSLSGFGTFFLKNSTAFVDQNEQSILPPGKEISFQQQETEQPEKFVKFIADKIGISPFDAELEVKKQVLFWNSTLEKNKDISVENLGSFHLNDSNLDFFGNRFENISPDYYGLEEINLSKIKKSGHFKSNGNEEKSYRFAPSFWWIFGLVAALLAITYVGFTQPEEIFGKKSFVDPKKDKAKIKVNKVLPINDSMALKNKIADSIKIDSAKTSQKK